MREGDANSLSTSSEVHRSRRGTILSISSDAGTPKTSDASVDGKPTPTAWTYLPTRRIRDLVTEPTTHTRGNKADVTRDWPTVHKSPKLTINETPVPGRIVFSKGSDRSSQY